MSEPRDSTIGWNKHEDASLISEIGPNGVNVGATFVPAKFGNGARIDANGRYIRYSYTNFNMNEFALSSWCYLDYDLVNGRPQDGAIHDYWTIRRPAGAIEWRTILFNNVSFGLFLQRDGINTSCRDVVTDKTAGTLFPVILICSRSHNFDGLKTLAIYIDGVETDSSVEALSDLGSFDVDMEVGNLGNSYIQPVDGVIDNPKVIQNPTSAWLAAEIANINNEGFPGARKLVDGFVSPLVDGSVLVA
jgi:hypothetical protein